MKRKPLYTLFAVLIGSLLAVSCSKNEADPLPQAGEGKVKLFASFGNETKLAQLTNVNDMAVDHDGLKNIGLYIYYSSDYNNNDLSKPYVRNLECTVANGEILVANVGPDEEHIYIYDQMTLVAFYPFNAAMSDPANYFSTVADEEKYPINRPGYNQTYIPYRAQTTTDPTISYYTQMTFYPKHTYKIELVVVSKDGTDFPTGAIQILPGKDPMGNLNPTPEQGSRQAWYDDVVELTDGGGGSYVNQYIGYIWTTSDNKNLIKKGDVLMKSDNMTLIASQDVNVDEQYVYRYGYNMTTDEIFIPTSSNLIHDAPTLAGFGGTGYQVCDIDLSSAANPWTPINMVGGRYDGGGHQITGMNVTGNQEKAGLFGQVQGNATIANVNLVNPVVNVTSTDETCYAGALIGRLNTALSEEDKQKLIGNLPGNLSPVVREALIKELLESALNSQSNVVGCKVTNPTITVNGNKPMVGTLVGQAGDRDENGTYKSQIWDSYVLGGAITVNQGAEANNTNAYVGGFVGLNNGYITRTYTTIPAANITAQMPDPASPPALIDHYQGFANMGDLYTPAEGGSIDNSFADAPDTNNGVQQLSTAWPSSWPTYTGKWPTLYTGWLNGPYNPFWYDLGESPAPYPTLQWERR